MTAMAPESQGAFHFLPVDTVAFGRGALDRLPVELDRLDVQRALVLTTRSLQQEQALLERVERLLGPRHAGTYARVRQHTPSADVWAAAREARRVAADVLVSFGGSSAIDCAKDVAYVLAADVADEDELNRRGAEHGDLTIHGGVLPHVAISTTLSASEFTTGASVTNEGTRIKGTLSHVLLTPRAVLLDPTVTLATPAWLWLSSGVKALDHAVERVYLARNQPLVTITCLEAIRLLTRHLAESRAATEESLAARGQCQMAAWFSTFGWADVRVGLSHILGHQIGARFDVPHGYTSCITMPHVLRFVQRWAADRLSLIARALGHEVEEHEAGEVVARAIERLVSDLGLPARLRDVGVPREGLEPLIAAAGQEARAWQRVPGGLAPGVTPEDVAALVYAAW